MGELYDSMGIWSARDLQDVDHPLEVLTSSFEEQLAPIEEVIRDSDNGDPGWSTVVDVDRAPASWLPWLAQMGGIRFPTGLTEAQQREYIRIAPRRRRGSIGALLEVAALSLTGEKRIVFIERQGNAYRLAISTYASETPDPARLLADVLTQKPAGIVLQLAQITGDDYLTLLATHTDYADVLASFADYDAVLADPSL